MVRARAFFASAVKFMQGVIKLISAIVLFGIFMAFRADVHQPWLRLVLAAVAFSVLALGIAAIIWGRK